MATMEGSDSNSVETSSLDQTQDRVLLLWRRHSIVVPSTKINGRLEKICARLAPGVSVAQVVFVDTGKVNSNDSTTVSCEEGRNVTSAFASP
jgi:hypothetical protein